MRMAPKRIQGSARQHTKNRKPHTTFSTPRKVKNQHFLYPISFQVSLPWDFQCPKSLWGGWEHQEWEKIPSQVRGYESGLTLSPHP